MPEYLSVEVYSSYSEKTLSPFIESTRQLLEDLGYAGENMETWLAQIAWGPGGGGFALPLEPPTILRKVQVNGQALFAMPIADGWTWETVPNLPEAWVSLSLAFETQTERQDLDTVNSFSAQYAQDHRYRLRVGRAIWSVMRTCSARFPQSLVYFTHEAQTGRSWQSLATGREWLWDFEVAFIPHAFTEHFLSIPEQFAQIHLPEGVGLANTARWSVLPWDE